MMFAARSFTHDSGIRPTKFAEVYSQGNSREPGRGGGAASFSDWDLIVDLDRQRLDRFA
jgi:hypothetical protein